MKKLLIFFAALGMVSCDSWLDINYDPNSPSDLTSDLVFPAAELNVAGPLGNQLHIIGSMLAQHYTYQIGTQNYTNYSRFIVSSTNTNSAYNNLYIRALSNLEYVREIASDNAGIALAVTVLRAVTFQTLVDAYGETPYTEATGGGANPTPAYDDGATVYDGVLQELDEALAAVTGSETMCDNMLFDGNTGVANWVRLANAIKLRMLMRMSNVRNVQAEVGALLAEDNFPTANVGWKNCWANQSGQTSPLYQECVLGSATNDIIMNVAYSNSLAEDDPRMPSRFSPNDEGKYVGRISGHEYNPNTEATATKCCKPVIVYNQPVWLITVAEIEFFKAEYAFRYGSKSDAKAHYEAALDAAFADVNADNAADFYGAGGDYAWDDARGLEQIGVQKWLSFGNVNGFEAWCEARRMGYPAFGSADAAAILADEDAYTAGTLYTPDFRNSELSDKMLLQRFKYADVSTSRNQNAPAQKSASEPVFWAK